METSNDTKDVIDCLNKGGCVIINVGGDREGHIGVLSDVGHYVVAICHNGSEFCVLDPAYRKNKYSIEGRKGKVREESLFLYVTEQLLLDETENRNPGFYLFSR